jgi:ABC-type transporter Mla MlaB component
VLRISVLEGSDNRIKFELEGRLIGPWVEELRRMSHEALERKKSVTLDLARLVFVDSPGVSLLRELARAHVTQENRSAFIRRQVEEAVL